MYMYAYPEGDKDFYGQLCVCTKLMIFRLSIILKYTRLFTLSL